MKKRFNDTGICIKGKHYMVETALKMGQIWDLVETEQYFTMNRPRQFGKTTSLYRLYAELLEKEEYLVILLSFEGIGEVYFQNETVFSEAAINMFNKGIKMSYPDASIFFDENFETTDTGLDKLSLQISDFVGKVQKKVVVLIDEVDKSTNNQLFLHFLGMLRHKYLNRSLPKQYTFHSVVLVGIHDVKTIKLKLRPDEERKLNSPWNIAVDFKVKMEFSPTEIAGMLEDYAQDRQIQMDTKVIAERIFYYTSGYPFLVSKMCKEIDETILPTRTDKSVWTLEEVEDGFKYLVDESYTTTIFDDLAKNLENNPELYQTIQDIVFLGMRLPFNITDIVVSLGATYGILDKDEKICKIHNRIFEQRIYMHILTRMIRTHANPRVGTPSDIYVVGKDLDMPQVMRKFQEFMRENYSSQDADFLEREGRLIFLSFLKPIINGKGFDFKEPNIGEERRMDIVITYYDKRYVLELKIWRGEAYHQAGLQQLSDYLDLYGLEKGYLLIFNFNKNKEYKEETITFKNKEIFTVWV